MRRMFALLAVAGVLVALVVPLGEITRIPGISWVVIGASAVLYVAAAIHSVNRWERVPVQFFGNVAYITGYGFTMIEPIFFDPMDPMSVQDMVLTIPAEGVQTKDNVPVDITGVLTIQITNVNDAVINVRDVVTSTEQRAVATLVDAASVTALNNLLEHRDQFCAKMVDMLGQRVATWGVKVKSFELKHFKIADAAIEQAIADNAKAEMTGRAQVTLAGFQAQVREMNNAAADGYTTQGWNLKLLETLQTVSSSPSSTIFLVPTGMMDVLQRVGTTLLGSEKKPD